MSNKEDTTREAIDHKLYELQLKIFANLGNPAVSEEVFSLDLPKLNDMILQLDDLEVDPRNLVSNIDEYFKNLPLQVNLTSPPSLKQFEEEAYRSFNELKEEREELLLESEPEEDSYEPLGGDIHLPPRPKGGTKSQE